MAGFKFQKSMSSITMQPKKSISGSPVSSAGSGRAVVDMSTSTAGKAGATAKGLGGTDHELFSSYKVESSDDALNLVGVAPSRPEIISCFDFLPMYTDDRSTAGDVIAASGRPPALNWQLAGSVFPTAVAELADLQIHSQGLKMETFKNEMAEYSASTSNPTTLMQRVYDESQQITAAYVIKYYNIIYQAIAATIAASDFKKYNIPTADIVTQGVDGYFDFRKFSMPAEYMAYSVRDITSGVSMSEYFQKYLHYSSKAFSTFSNTKTFLQLVQDLKSMIMNASPKLLDNPTEELRRADSTYNISSFTVDKRIDDAYRNMRSSLETMVSTVITPANFTPFESSFTNPSTVIMTEEGERSVVYTYEDYLYFVSSIPSDPVKRIAFVSHVVNRDRTIRHNLSLYQPATSDVLIFDGGIMGAPSSFPEDPSSAGFTTSTSTTPGAENPFNPFQPPEIPLGSSSTIENTLYQALGAPLGDTFSSLGKVGLSSVARLESTQDLDSTVSNVILPFEPVDSVAEESSYRSGTNFFFRNLGDADSDMTYSDFINSISKPYSEFYKGVYYDCYTTSIGLNRLLLGHPDETPTKNTFFYRQILTTVKDYLEAGFSGQPEYAANLAIFALADDPEIGYSLTRFMVNLKRYVESPEFISPYIPLFGPAPIDELGYIPDEDTTASSASYKFYNTQILEYIATVKGRDEDLANSMEELATLLHEKTTAMSNQVENPQTIGGGFPGLESSPTSYFLNSFRDKPFIDEDPDQGAYNALAGTWGLVLMKALNDRKSLLWRICTAVDDFESEMLEAAKMTYTAPSPFMVKGTFSFTHYHQTMLATEITRQIVESYLPVKVANTGYKTVSQTPADDITDTYLAARVNLSAPGDSTLSFPDTATTFSLNRTRIDVYLSNVEGFIDAVEDLPVSVGGGIVSGDPPGPGTSEDSEYSDEIKRSILDTISLIASEDVEIFNIGHILKTIGDGISHANDKVIGATNELLFEDLYTPVNTEMGLDLSFSLTDAAAKAVFKSISQDANNKTLSMLSPEQIQTMAAMWYGLSNSGEINTLFPGGKVLDPNSLDITRSVMQTEPFLADSTKRRKILTVGIPAKIVEDLRLQLSFNAVSEFGEEYFSDTRDANYSVAAENSFGLGGSAILSKYSLLKVKVYKRNLKNDFVAYKPKTFLFDPGLFVLPFQTTDIAEGYVDFGIGKNIDDIAKVTGYTKLSIMHENHGALDNSKSGPMFKSSGGVSSFVRDVYPWAFVETDEDGAGVTFETVGQSNSVEAIGGVDASSAMITGLARNHLVDFALKNYLKIVGDIDVNEHVFQIGSTGFNSFPDPLTSDIYEEFLESARSRKSKSSDGSSRTIEYIKSMCEVAYPFARENYRDRVVNSMTFDRVFNLMIDEDSFEEYALESSEKSGGGSTASAETGGSSGEAKVDPLWETTFSVESMIARQLSSHTSLDASYSDYYVTVELYQPVRNPNDVSDSAGIPWGSLEFDDGSETPGEDAVDGGLFEGGADKDMEILTPPMTDDSLIEGSIQSWEVKDIAVQEGIKDIAEKMAPILDNLNSGVDMQIRDIFERSVVGPFDPTGMDEEEDIYGMYQNASDTLESLLDDFLNSTADLSATDIIQRVQDEVLNNRAGSSDYILDNFTSGLENFTDVPMGTSAALESGMDLAGTYTEPADIIRGIETQMGSGLEGMLDLAGIESEILDNNLSSGIAGMGADSVLSDSFVASVATDAVNFATGMESVEAGSMNNLTGAEIAYGVSFEMMNSKAGIQNVSSAISNGGAGASMLDTMEMFQFHGASSYAAYGGAAYMSPVM